ncbi:MAG: DNA repair protein RecN [Micrococcus sp.]|nr:DNA repair protein RecN [Micrococcus sp.]
MIEQLRISGLGVICEAAVELGPGFSVVTGETGAGKTMVVTALGLLLGARADAGTIRHGAQRASVDAVVRVPADHASLGLADQAGAVLDPADDDGQDLLLSRTVSAQGESTRSRATAGGRTVPVGVLAEIGTTLVAVHGQTDQLRLRSAAAQRHALDSFGGAALAAALGEYRDTYTRWQDAARAYAELTEHLHERAREADALQRALTDIDEAAPQAGEDEELRERIRRLENADQLRAAAAQAQALLQGADAEAGEDVPGALTLIESARAALHGAPGEDTAVEAVAARLAEAAVVLTDIGADVTALLGDLDADTVAELDEAQHRLATLTTLQRLYGPELTDVLDWAQAQRPRLEELTGDSGRVEELAAEHAELQTALGEQAQRLSDLRREAATRLETDVTHELHALFMPDASFHVELTPTQPGPHGADDISLLLRPHAGSAPRPLGKGASGGELSRVMLALEVVLAATDPVPTFVFDEVDAGVGGEAAVAIGARLARLAQHVQVLCVTHLPQVAAYADRHIKVSKDSDPDAGLTTSDVRVLDDAARVAELARMLAGHADSAAAQDHARELLHASRGPQ